MKNLNIKTVCIVLIIAIALSITGCVDVEPNVTEPLCTTQPADPGSDGPSKPVDPTTPSEPAPSEPDVPTEPSEPDDPVIPSEPDDPIVPSEPVHEHEYVAVVTKATCIEVGFTTYACDCGDTYVGDRIEATGHQWSDWVVTKEPTVDENGAAVSVCAMCENTQSKVLDKIIPNHSHSYTEEVTKAATCTAEGVMTLTCSCGNSHTERIEKIPHSYKATVTKPTCTDKGYTTYKCSSCGDSYKDDYVTAKGHSYGNYKSNGDATCTKDGTKTGKCTACSATNTVTDTGSAKGHSYKATVTAPTCTEKGYTTNKCSVCGDSYKDSYVNATGHKFSSYTSNGDATCSKDGTKTATCANGCGTKDTKTDVGTALGHSYSKDSIVEPTLWSTGYTVYACTRCSDSYEADHRELTAEEKSNFLRAVEAAVVKYVNQFREEQGDIPATALPGMQKVAQYRAVQLSTNFAHDETDIQEALLHYQYGEWIDNTAFGGRKYYSANSTEAIAYTPAGHYYDADIIGYDIANQIRDSSAHWSYVGASRLPFIAVGTWVMEHDGASFGGFYTCIMLISTDKYE